MSELCTLTALGALACFTALLATGAARVVLALLKRRREPTRTEALLLALLAPLVLLTALVASQIPLSEALHHQLHHWIEGITISVRAHQLLHSANILLLLMLCGRGIYTLLWWGRVQASTRLLKKLAAPEVLLSGVIVRVLAMEKPRCFTVGGVRPTIFVSEGMLAAVPEAQREAMLAHEQAHCNHKDSVWTLALHAFYNLFLLPGSGALLSAWEDAAERACDLVAAQRVGSVCTVAEALVRVGSLAQGQDSGPLGSLAFGAKPGHLEARVKTLLAYDPTRLPPTARPLGVVVGLILVALLIVTPALAHLAELFAYH